MLIEFLFAFFFNIGNQVCIAGIVQECRVWKNFADKSDLAFLDWNKTRFFAKFTKGCIFWRLILLD